MQYKEWLSEWLANYIAATAKQKTVTRYSEIVRTHIVPKLGEYEVNEISPLMLQQFVTELLKSGNKRTGSGLSASSVNGIITVLQDSLKTAKLFGIADEYVGDKIKRPKIEERQVTCFTKREQQAIEQEMLRGNKPQLFGVVLCLYTGLRIGELLALTWEDIDFVRGTVSVNKSCHDGKDKDGVYGTVVETPKTATSKRIIPIPKQLLPFIRAWKKKSRSAFVVANGEKNISLRGYQRMFERLLNRLHIDRKGFHALRHTFATRALECGMDVKTLAEILGHKNATVTLNRYVHSLLEHKQDMMNKIGKLVFTVQNMQATAVAEI